MACHSSASSERVVVVGLPASVYLPACVCACLCFYLHVRLPVACMCVCLCACARVCQLSANRLPGAPGRLQGARSASVGCGSACACFACLRDEQPVRVRVCVGVRVLCTSNVCCWWWCFCCCCCCCCRRHCCCCCCCCCCAAAAPAAVAAGTTCKTRSSSARSRPPLAPPFACASATTRCVRCGPATRARHCAHKPILTLTSNDTRSDSPRPRRRRRRRRRRRHSQRRFTREHTDSSTHSLADSLPHSLTYSLTHSLTHSLACPRTAIGLATDPLHHHRGPAPLAPVHSRHHGLPPVPSPGAHRRLRLRVSTANTDLQHDCQQLPRTEHWWHVRRLPAPGTPRLWRRRCVCCVSSSGESA
jgi:hypothetical protein